VLHRFILFQASDAGRRIRKSHCLHVVVKRTVSRHNPYESSELTLLKAQKIGRAVFGGSLDKPRDDTAFSYTKIVICMD
jgi:hypothetical protein